MVGKVENKDHLDGECVANKQQDSQSKTPVQARRKLVFGGTTVVATLASGSVLGDGRLGYICSPSGFMSGNMSGNHDLDFRCGGFSPGGWRQNASKTGNQDGSLYDWLAAGCYPWPPTHPIYANNGITVPGSGVPTTFFSKFGIAPPGGDSSTSLREVLNSSGSVEFHVIAGLLNAKLFANGNPKNFAFYISPALVVQIYQDYRSMGYYQTSGGNKLYAGDIKDFFNRTYH